MPTATIQPARVEVTAAEADPHDSNDPQKLDNQLEPVAGKVAGVGKLFATMKQASERDHDGCYTAFSRLQPILHSV